MEAMHSDLREVKEQGLRDRFFRKKPVVIEAFQMTRERRRDNSEWPHWLNEAWNKEAGTVGAVFPHETPAEGDRIAIGTLEGAHVVSWGDWIVRGLKLELYPVKPEIFEASYEQEE